jgi:N-acetylmuramoyl-L-alanine amidase
MEISKHFLDKKSAAIDEVEKRGGTFASGLPDTIVIHYTAGPSALSAINTLKDSDVPASAHIVVDTDGSITQLVPFNQIAWHAGKSAWMGRTGLNNYSIGIEIVNAGKLERNGNVWRSWFGKAYPEEEVVQAVHRNESDLTWWHCFTEKQIEAVFELCKAIMKNYDIRFILGHEEISPGRKVDPGPAFPLDKLRDRLLHNDRKEDTDTIRDDSLVKGIVNASTLNIRSGPGTTYDTISKPLSRNTEVVILDEQKDWMQIEVKMTGWVSGKFVKKVKS